MPSRSRALVRLARSGTCQAGAVGLGLGPPAWRTVLRVGGCVRPTQRTAVLENSIDICRSADEVFDYCSDPLHEAEWNPKLKHIEKTTVGLVDVGARYDADFGVGGHITIEVVRLDPPHV